MIVADGSRRLGSSIKGCTQESLRRLHLERDPRPELLNIPEILNVRPTQSGMAEIGWEVGKGGRGRYDDWHGVLAPA